MSSSSAPVTTDLTLDIGGVTDTFSVTTIQQFTLSTTLSGNGSGTATSSPGGIDCGSDCSELYGGGTTVTLIARPDSDSVFVGWSGDPDCADATVEMAADTHCFATFDLVRTFQPTLVDLVFPNMSEENRICLNDGTGAYSCSNLSEDVYSSWAIAFGPMDCGNGIDMVVANQGPRNRICINDGAGSFTCNDLSDHQRMTRGVVLWDFDGDRALDLVLANNKQEDQICLNDGTGSFTCEDLSEDTYGSVGVALGDLDGVNGADLVFANWGEDADPGGANQLCLNNGAGRFDCRDLNSDINRSLRVAVADLDGQNGLDIVFSNEWARNRVCLNDGSAAFSCSDLGSRSDLSHGVAIGDIDGSGGFDVVIANEGQANRLCLNDGSADFTCSDLSADLRASTGVTLTDFDGDDDLDAVFGNFAETNQICVNDGAGSFSCSDLGTATNQTRGVTAGVIGGPAGGAPSGMVAYWPANGSGDDVVGTFSGRLDSGLGFATGMVDQSFDFDGVDDQVTLTKFPSEESFTIEGWVLYEGTNTPPWAALYVDPDHGLFLNDGRLCWWNLGEVHAGEFQLPLGEWHHVAITYDSTSDTMEGYVDGIPDTSTTVADLALPPGMPNVSIGAHGGWDALDGMIDDLAVYDRALSANEIAVLSSMGCAGKCLLFKGHFETGDVDRWTRSVQ